LKDANAIEISPQNYVEATVLQRDLKGITIKQMLGEDERETFIEFHPSSENCNLFDRDKKKDVDAVANPVLIAHSTKLFSILANANIMLDV